MLIEEDEYIAHYGILRKSGRYPWGSGQTENTRSKQFLHYVDEMKQQGLSDREIAKGIGMSMNELRDARTIANAVIKQDNISTATKLRDKGLSPEAIGEKMNAAPSTVRTWIAPGSQDKIDNMFSISNMLKEEVAQREFVDVGAGVEIHWQIGRTKMDKALAILKDEGYVVHEVPHPQAAQANRTKMKVLCPPGTTQKEVYTRRAEIQQTSFVNKSSDNGGRSFYNLHEFLKVNPNRVQVVHGEDGGDKADGVIYVRPNVKDISLGGNKYAQVRVAIGNDHYLKGMAIYKDDLPDGVDLQFHTAKKNTGNKLDAMKPNSEDPLNPFGSFVRQIVDNKGTPQEKVTSAMNIVNEEGKWEKWSRELSSQMLSKQSPELAQSQLDTTYERRKTRFEELKAITNPTVRKKMLEDFAGSADSAANHLKAAALPGQAVHVILPISSLKPTEVYADGYLPGSKVVLIRHPHAGKFEIPELTVNNNNAEAKKLLGNSRDAIGINHEVAKQLSGADFDGDTVLVIPNREGRIKVDPPLAALKDFDPIRAYPGYEGMKVLGNKQAEMGKISNLLTDMSLAQAPMSEIAQAVKHSMVVIDAQNKKLDHKRSYNDNNIRALQKKYQQGGASTLISRRKGREYVDERRPRPQKRGGPIDRKTGELVFEPTGRRYTFGKKAGQLRQQRSTKLQEVRDARKLLSDHPTKMERLYAEHSNRLKSLANEARLESLKAPSTKQSPTAKKVYEKEVNSLEAKLALARRNAPLERQAQIISATTSRARIDYNPDITHEERTKIEFQELEKARIRTGSDKHKIVITQEEWNAIQANAIGTSKLNEILRHADMKQVNMLATPKNKVLMTPTATRRAEQMLASGYSRSYVAKQLGVSLSTLDAATVGAE